MVDSVDVNRRPSVLRCGVCGYRLSHAKSSFDNVTTLLLCTNCGRAYAKIHTDHNSVAYKFLGLTHGNNEIREILHTEELK